jgi:two-component system sensor histidine kinase RegB
MGTKFLNSPDLFSDPADLWCAHVYNLRWLTVAAMVVLAFIGAWMLKIKFSLLALLTVAAGVYIYNLVAYFLMRKGWLWGRCSIMVELVIDIVAWSIYVGLSGGATNPLISILLPLVAIGAAVLPVWQAWVLGFLSVASYSLLWKFYIPLIVFDQQLAVQMHLLGMWLTFTVSVGVTVWFIGRMTYAVRERDLALSISREDALRNDWVVSLGSLAAGAAHELSTPLATMSTLVDELDSRPDLPDDLCSDIQLMHKQIDACKKSLTHLTVRAGNVRAERVETSSVEEWMRRLFQAWQTLHPATDIVLNISSNVALMRVTPDFPLEQALRNLVDNAVAANPKQIIVELQRDDKELVLQIYDQGQGIPVKLVERMRQVPPPPSQEGLGIGLALIKGTIDRYAGRVGFAQRPSGGIDAMVRLPLSRIGIS